MNKNASKTANSHGNENSSQGTRVSHKNGKHSVNLQKRGSTRFQFGLIIAMSVVYFGLEASFENFEHVVVPNEKDLVELMDYYPDPYMVEVDKPIKEYVPPKKVRNPDFKIVENDVPDVGLDEFIDKPVVSASSDLSPRDIEYIKDPEPIEEVIFRLVEDAPIFPGCEDVGKEERLSCFTDKIQEHIQKNFRYPDAAKEMGVKGRVYVGFKINKQGFITDVQLRGPHVLLEKEAKRIINKLPKMTPGKQRGQAVRVPFSIPINFVLN